MGIDGQIHRCGIGMFNCGAGPKLLYKSKVVCDVACGISAVSAVCFIGILLLMAGVEPNPGPTGAHERKNPLCNNWNRVASGYKHVKTGLAGFITCQISRRYNILKVKVDEQCDSVKPCFECTTNTLLPDHGIVVCNQKEKSDCLCQQDRGTRRKCPNNFCGHFYHLIVDDHVEKSPRWSSTDPTKWCYDHFQYAKCFLTTDSSASSVSDLDCADLLTIVIYNTYINCKSIKEVKLFQQCWKDQDLIFNSGNFEVTDSELDIYFDHMIHVLEDGKCLLKDPVAMQAVKELQKLKDNLMQLSDEDIDELLKKTSAPTFVFRYQYLLIEIGTKVIRKLFDVQVGPNFGYYLRRNTDEKNKRLIDKLQDLIRKKCISAAHTRHLPPMDNYPSSTNFDISLLTCLLRNVCGMLPAEDLVWIQPSGYSVEADITRLKECRNNLSHSGTVFISSTDFTTKWNELCEILKRLNEGLEESCRIPNLQKIIDESQTCCIDEKKREDFTKIINVWKEMDADVITEIKELGSKVDSMNENMDKKLDKILGLLTVKITADAQNQTASEEAQSSILDAAKTYASDGHEITCDPEVQTACNNLLSDMEGKGVVIDSVNTGSILITFRCPTRLALVRIRLYIADQMYREKLKVLENAVSKYIMSPVKLNISIAPEHTDSALMQTDIPANKKSVVLTFKCRGSKGVRNADGFLTNGSSNKMKELSNALSRSVGEEIKLHTTVDFDKLDSDGNIALQEEQYVFVFRYQYLLIEVGTEVLRKLLDNKVGNDFMRYLNANPTQYNQLMYLRNNNFITDAQKKLLPPDDMKPTSSNFDITLLALLLRNVCGLCNRRDPVWKTPAPGDLSVEADITRLRGCRNYLMHSDTVVLPETDFDDKWKELSGILTRLNKTSGITDLSALINNARAMDIDEELKDRLDKTIKAWDAMDQDMMSKLDRVEKRCLDGHERIVKRIKTVKQAVAAVQQEVKQGLSTVQQEVTTVQQEVKQGLSTVQQEVTTVQQGLTTVQQEVTTVQQGLTTVQQEVKQGWTTVQQEVTTVQHEVKQGLSTVQQRLATVQEDMKKLKSFPTEDAKNIQKDLIEFYKRRCNTLPVSPLFENKDDNILNIYKHPTMNSVEGTKQIKQITCYEDIFCKDSKACNQIYMTGDAGMGKTSFCTFMCLLWSVGKSGDKLDEEQKELQTDVEYMSKFDFVFYLSLRDTEHYDVIDMIKEQYLKHYDPLTIQDILRKEHCLILMDGLDEWTPKKGSKKVYKLPERIYSENCVYLTTCRPYRLEQVRLSHTRDIDNKIELTGIHGDSAKSYVEHVMSYMNKENSGNRKAYAFTREVRNCGLDDQLCIPMIASHLVVFWYEKFTLTHMPRALIYANILEMLFKRAEKKEVEFPSPTVCTLQLPDCLSGLEYLNKHVSLLYNVCHLSLRSLFKQDENVPSLVFTRKQLLAKPYCMSMEETEVLCKIGILSKNEVFGVFSVERLKISFIHKSYMEFLAALFISTFDTNNLFSDVTKSWKSLSDVLQFENFFPLLAGFSHDRIRSLFENMYSSISSDLTLCRINYIFHSDFSIRSLQNIIVKCYKESRRFNEANIVLKLDDFIFDDFSDEILKKLLLINTTSVKSIRSVRGKYYDEFDQIKNLQCLVVGDRSCDCVYDVKFTECMLQNQSTLHTLCIKGHTLIPELPVRSLQHLTSLSLSRFTMQHNSVHNLVKFLSDKVLIENLQLSSVWCANHPLGGRDCTLTLNLPHHTKLTLLYLEYVNILCNNVNNSSLKSIILDTFYERIVSCCIDVFNCIKYSQLEHLDINGFHRLDYNTMKTLAHTVKTLPYIKSLTLWNMKLPDDVLLQLHPDVTQVEIELYGVTMSRQCFHCFIESCVNNKSVIKVELDDCKITSVVGETHRELSEEESVDYMSEYLTSIPTVNITYKGYTWLNFETGSCQ